MSSAASTALYRHITRVLGIALAVMGVMFHRRGLMDWREPAYIMLCVTLQEAFLVLPALRRFRPYLLAFYLMLPALFVLATLDRIEPHRGDAISLALHTPLPLLLLPIQLMVLYTREASRLSSLVLVLTLFFVVAGLRRQVDDVIWPWLLGMGALAALYMAFSHPARMHLLLFPLHDGRAHAPLTANPGSLVRTSYFGVLWSFVAATMVLALAMFFLVPRVQFKTGEGPVAETRHEGGGKSTANGQKGTGTGGNGTRSLSSITSLSRGVDLGEFGEIQKSHEKTLEVRPLSVQTPRFIPTPLYLRAFTHATFDGERWSPGTPGNRGVRVGAAERGKRKLPGARALSEGFRSAGYKVVVLSGGLGEGGELPMTAEPVSLSGYDGDVVWDARSGILRAPGVRVSGSYGYDSVEFSMDYGELESRLAGKAPLRAPPEGAAPPAGTPERAYWLLPKSLADKLDAMPLVADVRERASRRMNGNAPAFSAVAAARWIVRYFAEAKLQRTGERYFRYSLQRRPAPGPDCIYRFLTTEPYGHCEYFASAMCAILRAAGVPARLAVGFHASKFNDEKGIFEVTGANAHAWVEVFVQGYGWILFDPTPPDDSAVQPDAEPTPEPAPPPPSPDATTANPDGEPDQPDSRQGLRDPLISFGDEAQQQLARDIEQGLSDSLAGVRDFLSGATEWMPDFMPQSPWARASLFGVPLTVALAYALWRRRKRRKLEKRVLDDMGLDSGMRGLNRRQQSLYMSLLLLLARWGFHKRPHETPREFAWRVVRRGGPQLQPLQDLTESFYHLRYGQPGEQALAEADFRRLLASFEAQLRRDAALRRSSRRAEGQSAA